MAAPDRAAAVVAALLSRHGRTYADDIGADVAGGGAPAMFRLLVFALLASARIRTTVAVAACRALMDAGWTSPARMAEATWEDRTKVLNRAGYARYDESTSRRLAATCRRVEDVYGGDVRRIRDAAGMDPAVESKLLQDFDGIGPVGADIFLREAQAAWPELVPHIDDRVRETARRLGLPSDPGELAGLVDRDDVPRLVAALVRARLDHDVDDIRAEAERS
jgi:endonuclease III